MAERVFAALLAQQRTAFDLSGLAAVHAARGEMERAAPLVREALAADPALPRTWGLIAGTHRFRRDDPLIFKAKRLLKGALSPASRRAIHYAMAKAMNDLGKYDRAWAHAAEGAAIATPPYDPADLDRWATDMVPAFDRDFLAPRPGRGDPTDAPIFVVGMPRSGTTLVESIIAATGAATPMGELPTIPLITQRAIEDDLARGNPPSRHAWTRRWRDEAFTRAARFYLDDVTRRAGGTPPNRFVDKLPGNLLYLGQIALMFPNARIVRMHRDARDTCVSCYLGQFSEGHQYTYRTDWLAAAWHSFRRGGDTIVPLIPNPVLDVRYEDLVREPEPQIRRLLEFLDLPFSDACLTPGDGYTTTTRSVAEVRKPINADSVGRWRRYRSCIGPLARALRDGAREELGDGFTEQDAGHCSQEPDGSTGD